MTGVTCRREGALSSSPHPQLLSIYNYTCLSFPLRHRPIRASLHKNRFSKNIKLFFSKQRPDPECQPENWEAGPGHAGCGPQGFSAPLPKLGLGSSVPGVPQILCCLLDRQSKLAIKQHVQDLIKRPQ